MREPPPWRWAATATTTSSSAKQSTSLPQNYWSSLPPSLPPSLSLSQLNFWARDPKFGQPLKGCLFVLNLHSVLPVNMGEMHFSPRRFSCSQLGQSYGSYLNQASRQHFFLSTEFLSLAVVKQQERALSQTDKHTHTHTRTHTHARTHHACTGLCVSLLIFAYIQHKVFAQFPWQSMLRVA